MTKVLHIITSLTTGGAEAMLQRLVRATEPLGYHSTVVSLTEASTIGRELEADGIPVIALGARGGILLPNQFLRLVRTFYRVEPDVVHCWMYHSNVVGQIVVRFMVRAKRPALIVSVRTELDAKHKKLSRDLVRRVDARLSSAADALIFNSHRGAQQHAALGYCMSRARIIPNFFDTNYFKPGVEEGVRLRKSIGCDDAILIGLIARFDKVKDHRSFILAARLVAARRERCHFVLVGRGCDEKNRQLMHWIRECGLVDRVHLLGELREIGTVQAALDIAVSSSIREGFPNTIGEAMACAVPCVVTDVGDSKFVVGDGGFVVPAGDPAAIGDAIIRLVDLPVHERRSMGERGRRRVITEFGMTSGVHKFVDVYEEVREVARGYRYPSRSGTNSCVK